MVKASLREVNEFEGGEGEIEGGEGKIEGGEGIQGLRKNSRVVRASQGW